MKIQIFSIFPEIILDYLRYSVVGSAIQNNLLSVRTIDIRDYGLGSHKAVDDSPYGGGSGMVMRCEPIFDAVEDLESKEELQRPLFVLSPRGERFNHSMASTLSKSDGFSLICGRYEGMDERIITGLKAREISIGDYVLAGGELGGLVIIESVSRLMEGVLGNSMSLSEESYTDSLLEYPQYTRPSIYREMPVPEVLLNGDHKKIANWRKYMSLKLTLERRPDLLEGRGGLTEEEEKLLNEFRSQD